VKTPVPQRAAGRKNLAAKGQALGDGSYPVPTVDYLKRAIRSVGRAPASKRPALKRLILKRARQLKATGAPGVKGTWAFQGAGESPAVDLAGPKGYVHGWIYEGGAGLPSVADHNAALRRKGVTPPTKAHPALTSRPPGAVKSPAPKAAPAVKGILSGTHPADRLTVASSPAATAKGMTDADLKGADQELSRRATALGKPGQLSRAHKAVRAEQAARNRAPAPVKPAAVDAAGRLAAARKSGLARKAGPGFKGQQGDTHVETYNDGSKWISKTLPAKADADREELAGKISDVLGAGAPSVVRDSDTHVHQPFVQGKVAASLYHDHMSDAEVDAAGDKVKALLSTPEGKRIGLLDKLIGNQDRHLGNWMISPDGKPVPIDHNWSWEGTKKTISPFSDAVYGPGIEPSDFTNAQMDEWQSRLAALKPGLNPDQQKLLARTMKSLARFRSGRD
jgi:hypothetical protein